MFARGTNAISMRRYLPAWAEGRGVTGLSRTESNPNRATRHLRPNTDLEQSHTLRFLPQFLLKIALKKHRFPGAAGSSSTRPEDDNCNYSSNDSCPALEEIPRASWKW